MIKLTVLYGHPTDPQEFEKYYSETHLKLVSKVSGITKAEYTKFRPNVNGSEAAYYRSADLYFNNLEEMQQTLTSFDGKAMASDIPNFATGGINILIGVIEK